MDAIEKRLNEEAYVNSEIPYTWLRAMDELRGQYSSFLNYDSVVDIAVGRCGVDRNHVDYLLKFLHEMGVLLWVNEPGLRDVVILDPIEYLVKPCTRIICNHFGTSDDFTRHELPEHMACNEGPKSTWAKSLFHNLTDVGKLDERLLEILWGDRLSEKKRLLMLLVKYGLFVPISGDDGEGGSEEAADAAAKQYLVPSLLPIAGDHDAGDWGDDKLEKHTCYLAFSLNGDIKSEPYITPKRLHEDGFLPSGFFERVLGKCISWAQQTAPGGTLELQKTLLKRDMAVVPFGNQLFRISPLADLNCIRVDAEGRSPLVITERVKELSLEVIEGCMESLHVHQAVAFGGKGVTSAAAASASFEKEEVDSMLFSLVSCINKLGLNDSDVIYNARVLLPAQDLIKRYSPWLMRHEALNAYDVFLSYRWNKFDSSLTRQLFDQLSLFSVGSDRRAVGVFLDTNRLQMGERFDREFSRALIHSEVVVPIFSHEALQRMKAHDPNVVDNALLEWILAVELEELYADKSPSRRLRNRLPV